MYLEGGDAVGSNLPRFRLIADDSNPDWIPAPRLARPEHSSASNRHRVSRVCLRIVLHTVAGCNVPPSPLLQPSFPFSFMLSGWLDFVGISLCVCVCVRAVREHRGFSRGPHGTALMVRE